MKIRRLVKLGLCVGLLLGVVPAYAGLLSYADFPTWSAAVSGVTTVTIPDSAPGSDVYLGNSTASVTYSGVVFSVSSTLGNGNFFNVGSNYYLSNPTAVLSDQEETSGLANILITFPEAVQGFALNYGTFDGSSVTFALSNGDSLVQASTASAYSVPDFVGVTDSSFSSVLITSSDYVLSINDISYATSNTSSTVPEPSSALLLAGAIGALLLLRRQFAKQ